MKWLHKLLNPHCPHCREELVESRICDTCEFLKLECARLQLENKFLLERLIPTGNIRSNENEVNKSEPKIIQPLHQPWHVRRQLLEKEDRAMAAKLAEENRVINQQKLEKEILNAPDNAISTATSSD
jgi:hypothetical protein